MRVLVTGATGLLGKNFIGRLLENGHQVLALARTPQKLSELPSENVFKWSDSESVPPDALRGVDSIVNLVGENIADGRWTAKRKERLWNSRIDATKKIVEAIQCLNENERPKVLVSASAVGIYGDTKDSTADEDTHSGNGFLADLCKAWEQEALKAQALGLRVVLLRSGVILSKEGGALKKMGPAVLGSGKQWMSWIHIDDEVRFILHSLNRGDVSGPFNLVSPNAVTNSEFTKTLAKVKGFPFTVAVPAIVLKSALGEMSGMLLESQRVIPKRTLDCGFEFMFSDLETALRDVCLRRR